MKSSICWMMVVARLLLLTIVTKVLFITVTGWIWVAAEEALFIWCRCCCCFCGRFGGRWLRIDVLAIRLRCLGIEWSGTGRRLLSVRRLRAGGWNTRWLGAATVWLRGYAGVGLFRGQWGGWVGLVAVQEAITVARCSCFVQWLVLFLFPNVGVVPL